jgi:hypothetical protein
MGASDSLGSTGGSASATQSSTDAGNETSTDGMDTTAGPDDPPAPGARVIFGDGAISESFYFVTYVDGVVSDPVPLGPPQTNHFSLTRWSVSPAGDVVVGHGSDSTGNAIRVFPVIDGVPMEPIIPFPGETTYLNDPDDFPQGGGGLLVVVERQNGAWYDFYHLPIENGVGEPVQIAPSWTDVLVGNLPRYHPAGDRVLVYTIPDSRSASHELHVVALDDPDTLHLIDEDVSHIFGVTADERIFYEGSNGAELFVVRLDGLNVEAKSTVYDGSLGVPVSPSLSPKGDLVEFGRDSAVYVVPVDGLEAGAPIAVADDFGHVGWSPDGAWMSIPVAGKTVVRVGPGGIGMPRSFDVQGDELFAGDSAALYLAPNVPNTVEDLLVLDLTGDQAGDPYAIANEQDYGPISGVTVAPNGGVAFVVGDETGQALWYVEHPEPGVEPVELTSVTEPYHYIHHVLFTPDGRSVVVARQSELLAIDLDTPGVEIPLASGYVPALLP